MNTINELSKQRKAGEIDDNGFFSKLIEITPKEDIDTLYKYMYANNYSPHLKGITQEYNENMAVISNEILKDDKIKNSIIACNTEKAGCLTLAENVATKVDDKISDKIGGIPWFNGFKGAKNTDNENYNGLGDYNHDKKVLTYSFNNLKTQAFYDGNSLVGEILNNTVHEMTHRYQYLNIKKGIIIGDKANPDTVKINNYANKSIQNYYIEPSLSYNLQGALKNNQSIYNSQLSEQFARNAGDYIQKSYDDSRKLSR